jgi:hypothetical protein
MKLVPVLNELKIIYLDHHPIQVQILQQGNILNSTQSSRENFKDKFLKIISRNDEDLEIINILSEESKVTDIKGKGKLIEEDIQDIDIYFTSPSLEDLNEKVKDS